MKNNLKISYLSCPELDDIYSDSTEETNATSTCNFNIQYLNKNNSLRKSKKFGEDLHIDTKNVNFCFEYENVYQDCDVEFIEKEEKVLVTTKKSSGPRSSLSRKSLSIIEEKDTKDYDEYNCIKSQSLYFEFQEDFKPRSSSILRLLENNMDRKKTMSDEC